jgi:putative thioredoxin
MSNLIVYDTNEATFERDVIERSHETPVVIDFWADWCGPCQALSPVLERLAREADGAWVLAKVDVDANPSLAASFGVQGIPAVKAIVDGSQAAEFVGALPEAQVRSWLSALGPNEADLLFEEAARAEHGGDLSAAADTYRRALVQDPGHAAARAALARVELLLRSAATDEETLRRRVHADPEDVDALLGLADIEAARGDLKGASDRLVEGVRATSGAERERIRAHLVELLDLVPPHDEVAMSARRALSLALF